MDDHAGYRKEVEENGFHFIHCERQPQDECHRVRRDDIKLVGPNGEISEHQNSERIADGTKVVAKYPGRLYDQDAFFRAQIVRSSYSVRLVLVLALGRRLTPPRETDRSSLTVVSNAVLSFVGTRRSRHLCRALCTGAEVGNGVLV